MRKRLCHRAREWASLQLDGELSEFERALLDAHLIRCEECREFAQDAVAITEQLRQSPLQRLERPVALPRRSRAVLSPPARAAAAALALTIVGLATLPSALRTGDATFRPEPAQLESLRDEQRELKDIRRASLKPNNVPLSVRRGLKLSQN